jgi:hypothetical protein
MRKIFVALQVVPGVCCEQAQNTVNSETYLFSPFVIGATIHGRLYRLLSLGGPDRNDVRMPLPMLVDLFVSREGLGAEEAVGLEGEGLLGGAKHWPFFILGLLL